MNAIRTLVQSEPVRVVGHVKEIGGSSWEVGVVEFENGVSLVYELPTRRRGNYWEIDGTEGAIVGNELLVGHKDLSDSDRHNGGGWCDGRWSGSR